MGKRGGGNTGSRPAAKAPAPAAETEDNREDLIEKYKTAYKVFEGINLKRAIYLNEAAQFMTVEEAFDLQGVLEELGRHPTARLLFALRTVRPELFGSKELKLYTETLRTVSKRMQDQLDSLPTVTQFRAKQFEPKLKDRHKATVVQEELGKKLPNTDVDKSGILANVLGFAGIPPAPKGVNLPEVPLPVGPRKEDGTFGGKSRRKRRKHRKTHKR